MRVRPIVTLTMAGLLLGACGSSSRSAASKKPTTVSKVTSTTSAASTPVTDLNGHQIVGVKAQDVSAELVPDKPLDRATHALVAKQLVAARAVAMQYPTVADATAAGYHLVGGGFGPGSGAHYIGGFSMTFDPSHPLALIYDGISPASPMVGLMYTRWVPRLPRASRARTTIGTGTAVCAPETAATSSSRPTPA